MPRLPRFKRSPEIPPLRLTSRDGEILKCLQRHRFLRSDHITALIGGSRQQVLRRLQLLFHHGYLERPRCQIDYYQSGSHRIAYGLGNKGAAWLKRELSLQFHQLDWKPKSRVGRLFLEHALLVSDIMVAVELACRNRKEIRLLSADDLRIPNMREPFQWKVDIGQRQKMRRDPRPCIWLGGQRETMLVFPRSRPRHHAHQPQRPRPNQFPAEAARL